MHTSLILGRGDFMPKEKSCSSNSISTSILLNDISSKFQDIPRKVTKDLLSSFLTSIEDSIVKGHKVRLDKIGIIAVKERAARTGRNPKTNEPVHIPAGKRITFRTSNTLKEKTGGIFKKKKSS